MNWLLWKEYRLNRLIVLVGVFLLLFPYAVAAGLLAWHWRPVGAEIHGARLWQYWRLLAPLWWSRMVWAALYSLGISQLTFGLLGGSAIAGERVDRSAEFLAYLPLSRGRILAAKLLFTLAVSAVIWLPNLVILGISVLVLAVKAGDGASILANITATGLVFFGVGWLLSTMTESPSISVCVGLVVPVIVLTAICGVGYLADLPADSHYPPYISLWYQVVSMAIALASFGAGTVYYLRRVEP